MTSSNAHVHYSVDIETLGLKLDAIVLSIAAVEFNPYSDKISSYEDLTGKTSAMSNVVYCTPSVARQILLGRTFEPDNIKWWKEQNTSVVDHVFDATANEVVNVHTRSVLEFFNTLTENGEVDPVLWANPAVFDLAMLRSLWYDLYPDKKYPIHYMHELDGATLQELTGVSDPPIEFIGEKHNPIDDAVHQAREIQWHIAKLGARDPKN